MDKKDNADYKRLRREWNNAEEETGIAESELDPGSEEALKESNRLKELSKDLRKEIKDNYKDYKKDLKGSDDPLADEKISVAKEQTNELRDKIKSGIENQRNDLRGYDPDEAMAAGLYMQDPLYGSTFFPDPMLGGIYPSELAVNEAIRQGEIHKDDVKEEVKGEEK